METGEGDELELVAIRSQLTLEAGDRVLIELLPPVERRRAVVGEKLVRKLRVYSFGEMPGFFEVRLRSLAPDHIRIGRISEPAGDCRLEPAAHREEPFASPIAGQKLLIPRANAAGCHRC